MRTVVVFFILAAIGTYLNSTSGLSSAYVAEHFLYFIFQSVCGGCGGILIGIFLGFSLSMFVAQEETIKETRRLAPLEGEIVGRTGGVCFVRGGKRERSGEREYFYSQIHEDGARELCGLEIKQYVHLLEDPALKEEGVYTIHRRGLDKKHPLAGWALNPHADKHVLRVPVGTVLMNFEGQ